MEQQITVREYADESNLFGDNSTDGIDVTVSINKYAMMISDAISAAYPGATVFVTRGNGVQPMTVNGLNAGQMYGEELARYSHIEQIIHDAWESWEWVIETAPYTQRVWTPMSIGAFAE